MSDKITKTEREEMISNLEEEIHETEIQIEEKRRSCQPDQDKFEEMENMKSHLEWCESELIFQRDRLQEK